MMSFACVFYLCGIVRGSNQPLACAPNPRPPQVTEVYLVPGTSIPEGGDAVKDGFYFVFIPDLMTRQIRVTRYLVPLKYHCYLPVCGHNRFRATYVFLSTALRITSTSIFFFVIVTASAYSK